MRPRVPPPALPPPAATAPEALTPAEAALPATVAAPPPAASSALALRLRTSLSTRLESLLAERAGVLDGEDEEAVHRMRVASRRTREVLALAEGLLEPRAAARLRKTGRAVGRALGDLREEQVTASILDRFSSAARGGEAVAADHVRLRLLRRIRRAGRSTRRQIERSALEDVERLLQRALEVTELRPLTPAALLGPRALCMEERLSRARPCPDDTSLHEVRIATKRLRYAVEMVAGGRGASLVRRLRELQESLGTFHDLTSLETRIEAARDRAQAAGCRALTAGLECLLARVALERAEAEAEALQSVERWPPGSVLRRVSAVALATGRADRSAHDAAVRAAAAPSPPETASGVPAAP